MISEYTTGMYTGAAGATIEKAIKNLKDKEIPLAAWKGAISRYPIINN